MYELAVFVELGGELEAGGNPSRTGQKDRRDDLQCCCPRCICSVGNGSGSAVNLAPQRSPKFSYTSIL